MSVYDHFQSALATCQEQWGPPDFHEFVSGVEHAVWVLKGAVDGAWICYMGLETDTQGVDLFAVVGNVTRGWLLAGDPPVKEILPRATTEEAMGYAEQWMRNLGLFPRPVVVPPLRVPVL